VGRSTEDLNVYCYEQCGDAEVLRETLRSEILGSKIGRITRAEVSLMKECLLCLWCICVDVFGDVHSACTLKLQGALQLARVPLADCAGRRDICHIQVELFTMRALAISNASYFHPETRS